MKYHLISAITDILKLALSYETYYFSCLRLCYVHSSKATRSLFYLCLNCGHTVSLAIGQLGFV